MAQPPPSAYALRFELGGQAERAAAWISELAGRGVTVDDDAELQRAMSPASTGTSSSSQ